jgi:hypothetical protein
MYCPTCGHPVPQAESDDSALDTKEALVADDQTPVEASADESGQEIVAAPARTLTDADISALAAVFAAALKPTESDDNAEETPEVAPEEAPEAPAEETPEVEPEAEESHELTQETEVTENNITFTAEQVAQMVSEAATKAANEAVEAARTAAVESYRTGEGFRKGYTASSTGSSLSELSESDELDPRALAEMNSTEFRKLQSAVWAETPFFKNKFAQAERGF